MEIKSLAGIVKTAVLAGLIAATVSAGFHWILTEPLIDRAVELEDRSSQSPGSSPREPVVSRPVQKLGLLSGFLLYGVAWGILLGLLAFGTRSWSLETRSGKQAFLLAMLLGWSAVLFPLLKYPANPPGVGEAETIAYRQGLFLALVVLSLIGTSVTVGLERRARRAGRRAGAILFVFYLVYLAVLFLALPSNPDPIKLPVGLVQSFRALSLAGQILFWLVMGGVFALLVQKETRGSWNN